MSKFTPTLYLYKLLHLALYLYSIKLIGTISRKLKYSKELVRFNQLFFALNPLVLIEALANVHNDLPMMTFFLVAFNLFLSKRYIASFISTLFSFGIKYVTLAFLPFTLLGKKFKPQHILYFLTLVFTLAPIFYYHQYQPWYVIWPLTTIALTRSKFLKTFAFVYSFNVFFRYIPFIQTGLWQGTKLQFALLTFTLPTLYLIYYATKLLSQHHPCRI